MLRLITILTLVMSCILTTSSNNARAQFDRSSCGPPLIADAPDGETFADFVLRSAQRRVRLELGWENVDLNTLPYSYEFWLPFIESQLSENSSEVSYHSSIVRYNFGESSNNAIRMLQNISFKSYSIGDRYVEYFPGTSGTGILQSGPIFDLGILEIVNEFFATLAAVQFDLRDQRDIYCWMDYFVQTNFNIFEVSIFNYSVIDNLFITGNSGYFYQYHYALYDSPYSDVQRGDRVGELDCTNLAVFGFYSAIVSLIDLGYINYWQCVDSIGDFANPYLLREMQRAEP